MENLILIVPHHSHHNPEESDDVENDDNLRGRVGGEVKGTIKSFSYIDKNMVANKKLEIEGGWDVGDLHFSSLPPFSLSLFTSTLDQLSIVRIKINYYYSLKQNKAKN